MRPCLPLFGFRSVCCFTPRLLLKMPLRCRDARFSLMPAYMPCRRRFRHVVAAAGYVMLLPLLLLICLFFAMMPPLSCWLVAILFRDADERFSLMKSVIAASAFAIIMILYLIIDTCRFHYAAAIISIIAALLSPAIAATPDASLSPPVASAITAPAPLLPRLLARVMAPVLLARAPYEARKQRV